jgi:hypothetical protein
MLAQEGFRFRIESTLAILGKASDSVIIFTTTTTTTIITEVSNDFS